MQQSRSGLRSYGVEAASLYYFGKHASDLAPEEAAILIGISNSPSAAAGQASRQNSLRMAICDQRISRPDAQGDCVVKDNAVKLGPNLL